MRYLFVIAALALLAGCGASGNIEGGVPNHSGIYQIQVENGAFAVTPYTPIPQPTATVYPTLTPTPTPTSSGQIIVYPEGVFPGPFNFPDGVTVMGAGQDKTWLKGHLDFGSNQTYIGLKIGDQGNSAVQNKNGATNTVFRDVRFRGGGGTANDRAAVVIFLGYYNAVSYVTFENCKIERAFGPSGRSYYNNNISIYAKTYGPHHITFDNVTNGVSNGSSTGSPRMGLEVYTADGATQTWHDIVIRNSTWETMDSHGMDFSDEYDNRSYNIIIENNLIKGAGKNSTMWGSSIDFEYPMGVVIRGNTIWRGRECGIQSTKRSDPYGPSGAIIENNILDWSINNGISSAGAPISLTYDPSVTLLNNIIRR